MIGLARARSGIVVTQETRTNNLEKPRIPDVCEAMGVRCVDLARRIRPIVPSVVLAQAWRGGPQPNLSRLLRGCVIEALAENAAREIGRLLAKEVRPTSLMRQWSFPPHRGAIS